MSPPLVPGVISRKAGAAPLRTKTGRPDADRITSPSPKFVLGRGNDEISPAPPLTVEGAIEIGCGSPKRTVPRVTTSELSTRDSTGTRIGDGSGGAVRAAISAGDWILEPAYQAPSAKPQARPRTVQRMLTRFAIIMRLFRPIRESVLTALIVRCSGVGCVAHCRCSATVAHIIVAIRLLDLPGEQLLLYALFNRVQHLLLHFEALDCHHTL